MSSLHHKPLPNHSTLLIGRSPREFCCFPRGVYHSVIEAHPPIESLMIRAPSVDDNVYEGSIKGD